MSTPTLKLQLIGSLAVSEFLKEMTWTKETQYEQTFYIKDTDSDVTVDYSNVENIRMMIFRSTADFTVKITTAIGTFPMSVQDVLTFSPDATLALAITAITISTASTTDQTIDVQVFGESA